MAIGNAVQRGAYVYVCNEKGGICISSRRVPVRRMVW
jgi:hypothetical protein